MDQQAPKTTNFIFCTGHINPLALGIGDRRSRAIELGEERYMPTKDEICFTAAKEWFRDHPQANPEFSAACGMIFTDNADADNIENAIVTAGEAAGYWIDPEDVVRAALKAKDEVQQ
jgi:hypothetical protein